MASPGAVVVVVAVAVVVAVGAGVRVMAAVRVGVAVGVGVVVVVVVVVAVAWRDEVIPSEARLASILAALGRAVEGGHAWSVYPSEATVLLAEIERLRALEADAERAAIVAYLREQANAEHPIERGVPRLSPAGRGLLLLYADHIARGAHRRKEEK